MAELPVKKERHVFSDREREIVVNMKSDGVSWSDITRYTSMSRRTGSSLMRRFEATGSVAPIHPVPRRVRSDKMLNAHDLAILEAERETEPRRTLLGFATPFTARFTRYHVQLHPR